MVLQDAHSAGLSAAVAERAGARVRAGDIHPEPSFFDELDGREGGGFGPHSLEIRSGGIRARLEGLSSRQQSELAARYGIFARPGSDGAAPDLLVSVHRSPCSRFLELPRTVPAETYRLLSRQVGGNAGGDLMAWSYEWAARWSRSRGRVTLAAASGDRKVFDRIVENCLRLIFAHEMLERGGMLLHGAGVVRNGSAYVFFGPSGAGKTTVTTLSAGDLILSDDLVMIVRRESGFAACSVPFRGLLTPAATTDRDYPLAGLFRLVQDREDRVEPLDAPRAVGELVQSLPFVTDCPEAAPRMLEVASAVAAAAPVSRLRFRKDRTFWRVVENAGRSAA